MPFDDVPSSKIALSELYKEALFGKARELRRKTGTILTSHVDMYTVAIDSS